MTTKPVVLQSITADNMDLVTGQQLTDGQAQVLRQMRAAYEGVAWTGQDGVWGSVYLDNVDYDGTARGFSGVTGSLAAKGLYSSYDDDEYEAFGMVRIA